MTMTVMHKYSSVPTGMYVALSRTESRNKIHSRKRDKNSPKAQYQNKMASKLTPYWSKVGGNSHLFGYENLKQLVDLRQIWQLLFSKGGLVSHFIWKQAWDCHQRRLSGWLWLRMSSKCCMLWPCWQVSRFAVSRMLKTMHRGCCQILNKKSTVTPTTCIVLLAWLIWTLIHMSFLDPRGGARSEWWKPKKASCCWDVH
jgi:hypothetical protein